MTAACPPHERRLTLLRSSGARKYVDHVATGCAIDCAADCAAD